MNRLFKDHQAEDILIINERLLAHDFCASGGAAAIAAGVDLALWDLQGRVRQQPVWQLLGGRFRDRLKSCYPIFGAADPAECTQNLARVQ